MRLTKLCKDSGSGDGGCPAAYLTDEAPTTYHGPSTRGVAIQGNTVDQNVTAQADDLAEGEIVNWVPDNVILRAAPRILVRRGLQAVGLR